MPAIRLVIDPGTPEAIETWMPVEDVIVDPDGEGCHRRDGRLFLARKIRADDGRDYRP